MNGWWPKDGEKYSISKGYRAIQDQMDNVRWDDVVWNRVSHPKHCYIWWLIMWKRLQVKERLARLGICEDSLCWLCGTEEETHQHLFMDCIIAKQVWCAVNHWLQISIKCSTIDRLIWWCSRRRKQGRIQNKIVKAICAAVLYSIWVARNAKAWHNIDPSINCIVDSIKEMIRHRSKLIVHSKMTHREKDWLQKLLYSW